MFKTEILDFTLYIHFDVLNLFRNQQLCKVNIQYN